MCETLKNSNNSEFVWTKDDLGKSVAQNVLSEVANQHWVGYVHYAGGAAGPVGAFTGGVAAASFGDYYKDRIKSNLKKDTDR